MDSGWWLLLPKEKNDPKEFKHQIQKVNTGAGCNARFRI
jgi:hypothetical protein